MKNLFFATTLLAALLTGCNQDENGINNGKDGESDVYMRFIQEGARAEGGEVANNTAVSFTDGMILFVDGDNDQIKKSFTIGANGDYTITQLQSGTTFTGISNAATVVYVIGNNSFNGPTAEGSSMATLLREATSLADQSDSNFGVDNATLVGEGNLVVSLREGVDREAEVTVSPIIGRIEIGKLTLTDENLDPAEPTDTIVTSFKLAGIFVNNFYFEAAVHGGLVDASIQPFKFGKVPENYDVKPDGQYETNWANYIFDQYSAFSASDATDAIEMIGKSVTPENAGKVWAYNLFSTPLDLPRIILHLKDVEVEYYIDNTDVAQGKIASPVAYPNVADPTLNGTAYLTVLSYTDNATNTNIQTIETGNIYKINELKFNYFDLTDIPEGNYEDPDDEFKVWVEVKTLSWKAIDVTGGW